MIYLLLFVEFFKVGLFCFGGAFGMIPIIKDTVLAHSWLTESEFYNFIGVCESTPGPIAVNMATYIGSTQAGFFGSVCATLGVVLPSFIIILIIAAALKRMTENKYFKGFLQGVKPVIIALIISTGAVLLAKSLGYSSITTFDLDVRAAAVFALLIVFYFGGKRIFKKKPSSVLLIVVSACLGIAVCSVAEHIPL